MGKIGCAVLFLAPFYAVGIGLLGYGLLSAWRSTRAGGWPTAPGAITAVALREEPGEDGPTCRVEVDYRYTVNGTEYTGSRLAYGYAGSNNREAHEAIHARLKAAEAIDVRYDPADPASAVLSYGVHQSIRFVLLFAATWLAFIVGFSLIMWLGSGGDEVLERNLSVR